MHRLEGSAAAYPTDIPLPAFETRLLDRIIVLLVLTDELLAEFTTEDANELLWAEQRVRAIYDELDRLTRRFAQ